MATKDEIEKVIDEKIRPGLQLDGGDVELVDYRDQKVLVKLRGACSGCPFAQMTLKMTIEGILKEHFPEIKEVVEV